jgi:N-acetylglucosaminyldiphosphoundecaprenol N-acetyl-beta-D-mannosaminyltransferase
VRIDGIGPRAAVARLLDSMYGQARRVHLCNSWTLALAVRDREYRRILNESDLNFADGHYVAMVGRWRGHRDLTDRVYGPALMLATMDQGRSKGMRHYLYGATDATVSKLAATLRERYPGLKLVGVEAPPFRGLTPEEEDGLAARIADAKPDVIWVGIGTPRQDTFVARYAERLGCTLVPVGAAFDFNSGMKRSAPPLIQRAGMEWLYRFAKEPRRLWRRYLIGIPTFMFGVLSDLVWSWRDTEPRRADVPAQTERAGTSLSLASPPVLSVPALSPPAAVPFLPRHYAPVNDGVLPVMPVPVAPAYAGIDHRVTEPMLVDRVFVQRDDL